MGPGALPYRECRCVFQLTYTYQAESPALKSQSLIWRWVRDTATTLKIGINRVIRTLKNSR
ncbi:hypothetical protein HW114_02790 [Serratia symbiotica]|uniref:Uncharacterized protein n=1 Tax=Serratia symbiotica TaxID=138074 RepID=A0A7D5NW93_9GAMM|nr:hypothetical protein [Serratia symbiotica]QLH64365.1 hypothetical protein SYMBAF_09465 [Serratia symbiotica]QTP15811.1 hypothetical protein GPZ83_0004515 [Serratia symbiotica]